MNAMKKLFTFVLLTAFLMSSFFGVAHAVFVVDPAASTDTPAGKPVVDPGIGKPQGKPVVDPAMAPESVLLVMLSIKSLALSFASRYRSSS
jgi:hypothetical protein